MANVSLGRTVIKPHINGKIASLTVSAPHFHSYMVIYYIYNSDAKTAALNPPFNNYLKKHLLPCYTVSKNMKK